MAKKHKSNNLFGFMPDKDMVNFPFGKQQVKPAIPVKLEIEELDSADKYDNPFNIGVVIEEPEVRRSESLVDRLEARRHEQQAHKHPEEVKKDIGRSFGTDYDKAHRDPAKGFIDSYGMLFDAGPLHAKLLRDQLKRTSQ